MNMNENEPRKPRPNRNEYETRETDQVDADQVQTRPSKVRIVPSIHLASSLLIDLLKQGKIGDVYNDEELTKHCGYDTSVRGDGYGYLQTALRHTLTHYGLVWSRIRGAGMLKCLGASETIEHARNSRRNIHRRSKRMVQRLRAIRSDVAADDQSTYLVDLTHANMLAELSSAKTARQLEAQHVTQPVNMRKLLERLE